MSSNLPFILLIFLPLMAVMAASDLFVGEQVDHTLRFSLMRPVGKGKLFFSKAAAVFLLCAFDLAVLYVVSTVAQVGLGGGTEGILTSLGACLLDLIPLAVLVLFFCLINQLVRGSSLTVLLCVVLYIGLLVMGTYLPAVGGWCSPGISGGTIFGLGLPCPSSRCCPALAFWRGTAWSLDAAAISSLTGRKPDGKMAGRNPKGGGRHAEKNHPEGTVPADQSGDAGALPADRRGRSWWR